MKRTPSAPAWPAAPPAGYAAVHTTLGPEGLMPDTAMLLCGLAPCSALPLYVICSRCPAWPAVSTAWSSAV